MSEKQKILFCGDVNGKFKSLFKRVETVNKKSGPFDYLFCVGNFFGSSKEEWELCKTGVLKAPIPTYVLGPNKTNDAQLFPDKNGCELCHNISYLGKRGIFTGSSGLKVAYVSGIETKQKTSSEPTFNFDDAKAVKDICCNGQLNFQGVDILLTSQWPREVAELAPTVAAVLPSSQSGSSVLSWLAVKIKPRYHFCALKDIFYERPPYRNREDGSWCHVTRFIALSSVANKTNSKWLYALNLMPMEKMKKSELDEQTTDETDCPYQINSLELNGGNQKTQQFFYDMNPVSETSNKRKRNDNQDQRERKQHTNYQGECWFCLASAEVEKHLVISIGDAVYLAVAKGGLVPEHVLILPIGHHQSVSDCPEDVFKEIKRFKSALKKFFKKQNKVPVFFERNYKTSHLQVQAVPVSAHLTEDLKTTFENCANEEGFQLDELPPHADLEQVAPPGTPYFYVELPSGEKLFHRIRKHFPLQFGRDVLASEDVLNIPERANWKDCKLSKEEETELVTQFRKVFKPYDFTL